MYSKPAYLKALKEWEETAEEEGVSRAELAYRWVASNSALSPKYGDAIIIGASSIKQVDETITGIKKGSLSEKACKKIDEVWETIKHEAPLDNYHK
jgi:aflatoxin B1 aldehyde reductase